MTALLRSDKLQKQIYHLQKWAHEIPPEKCPLFEYSTQMYISDSIWEDIDVQKWLETFLSINGEIQFCESVLKNPCKDSHILIDRQVALRFFQNKTATSVILNNTAYTTLEWFRNISVMNKNYLYNSLFPSAWYMKWLYSNQDICTFYHWYKCYITPASGVIYPMTLVFGPYWFVRKKLKMNLTVIKYIKLVMKMILMIKKTAKTPLDWYKFVIGAVVYMALYIYATVQSIDLSLQLHSFRNTLLDKVKVLISVQKKVLKIYKSYGAYEYWKPFASDISINDLVFPIKYKASTIYNILTNDSIKTQIHKLCKVCVIHDTLIKLSKMMNNGGTGAWCMPKYGNETFIGNMKNPSLSCDTQVANPIRLQKHLIISGANAGGKTTYVKSLLWNIVLAQSFGIVYGNYAQIKLYDAILHHHRVKDITGEQSLFQAEMFKIKESLEIIKSHKNVIYFLDEPMHSTNPIDGTVMLKSLLCYLSNSPNLQILLTSHFFSIQSLEKEMPDRFKNVSVKAKMLESADIMFDFKIYNGGSDQTIGIELLERSGFPAEIFEMSAKLKSEVRLK